MTVSILISPSSFMPTSRSECHFRSFAIVGELYMRLNLCVRGKCRTTFIGVVFVPSRYLFFPHWGHDSRSLCSPRNKTHPDGSACIILYASPSACSILFAV